MANVKICIRLKRTGVPGYEVVEYRRLTKVPQLGAIIETRVNKNEIRARVIHVHAPERKDLEHTVYLDEVEK
jgi:hypothetical protein